MDIVKLETGKNGYRDRNALRILIAYATCPEKTKGYIGAIGTNPDDPAKMLEQMQFVKKAYGKNDRNYRQLRHIIISPDPQWGITADVAYRMAYDIAKFYGNRYQICFGVHSDTDHVHIHLVQNTVSYIDGKLFSGAWVELNEFKMHVQQVVYRYLPQIQTTMEEFEFMK